METIRDMPSFDILTGILHTARNCPVDPHGDSSPLPVTGTGRKTSRQKGGGQKSKLDKMGLMKYFGRRAKK